MVSGRVRGMTLGTRVIGDTGASGPQPSQPYTNIANGNAGVNFSPAASEIGDVMTGRITLAALNLIILGMVAFYFWTRQNQGGG